MLEENSCGLIRLDNNKEPITLLHQIGEGASSKVFKCLFNNMIFAIKLFNCEQENVYLNETKILSSIRSSHVVNMIEHGKGYYEDGYSIEEEKYYIILDYIENGDLFDYVAIMKQGFPEDVARMIFLKILNALGECHREGIVHNDIKAENCLITNNFDIKLTDFGYAKITNNIEDKLFDWKGTLLYSSPEVKMYETKGYYGIKNDLYSLGILLFVITVGTLPFNYPGLSDIHYKQLAKEDYVSFWKAFESKACLTDECKDLINSMICFDCNKRISMDNIKNHKWLRSDNSCTNSNINEMYMKEFEFRKIIVDVTKEAKMS